MTARRPVPLVVDFHGIGSREPDERDSSSYPAVLDPEGVMMAFPDGLRGPAGTGWNVGPCCVADVDDVAFARALVAQIQTIACIDPTRVYAVGVLTGGGMAHYVACHAADVFAAVAPAAFDLLEENVNDCVPARPITVISFRGTADSACRTPVVLRRSSPACPSPSSALRRRSKPGRESIAARAPRRRLTAKGCSSYAGCQDGVEVDPVHQARRS